MSANLAIEHNEFRIFAVVTDSPWYENCYIVQHVPSKDQVIVDPGSNPAHILSVIAESGGSSRQILLTHAHPDHVGAVRALQDKLKIPCRVYYHDEPLLRDVMAYARDYLGVSVEEPLSFDTFDDHDLLTLGGQTIRVIPTPGHTQGSVCYAIGKGIVLTGDTLFNQGVGRTDLPGGNASQLAASIDHLLEGLEDDARLLSGHGPDWTAGEAKRWWKSARGWMMS